MQNRQLPPEAGRIDCPQPHSAVIGMALRRFNTHDLGSVRFHSAEDARLRPGSLEREIPRFNSSNFDASQGAWLVDTTEASDPPTVGYLVETPET